MLDFPNAKINLGLNVTGIRSDGFHNIETVMIPVGFCDILEILPEEGQTPEFRQSGLAIPGKEEDNLCIRAYRLVRSSFKIPNISMHLHKVIPMGSGLGGGSSDATSTIKLLNRLFSLEFTDSQMRNYTRKLGSDCAFFIRNKPVFAKGRGDQFEPIDVSLTGYSIVIIIPPVHVDTANAYKNIKARRPVESIKSILKAPPTEWKERLLNDFEESVFRENPGIRDIKKNLYTGGAIYASMSGSGSAVYGLFDKTLPDPGLFKGCNIWKGTIS